MLEAIGVREVGEFEQVEAILKQRYSEEAEIPDKKTYKNDLIRFISLVEDDPKAATLFEDYWIFEGAGGQRTQPGGVYLDTPYVETGLRDYYQALGNEAKCVELASSYSELGVPQKKFAKFVQLSGARIQLEISEVDCRKIPIGTSWRKRLAATLRGRVLIAIIPLTA